MNKQSKQSKPYKRQWYGTTTVGEKGQIVVPAEAREAMNLKKGEKLLVFGMGCDMIAFSKVENLEKFATHLAERLASVREVIKKTGAQ